MCSSIFQNIHLCSGSSEQDVCHLESLSVCEYALKFVN